MMTVDLDMAWTGGYYYKTFHQHMDTLLGILHGDIMDV